MHNINDNAVQLGSFVRKLFNARNYRMKYFRHEIFAIYGIALFARTSWL